MPVVTAYFADTHRSESILGELATAVATALGLPHDAVHVMHVPVSMAVTGTEPVAPWPTALLHGGRRSPEAMANAAHAVRAVLAQECGADPDRTWVQWILTE